MNQMDPDQFAALLNAIYAAANGVIFALGCVAFWIGFSCWENSAK